jgi:3-hydroxyisobutyrate dehydrogenase
MKVAYIGLGSMGAPQARLIARGGLALTVYDAYPDALGKFGGIAHLANSPAEAAQGADIACVCVRDDQQVNDAVLGEQGLAQALGSGSLLLIHSTIRIETLHALKAALAPRGIALVDAPVSRTRRSDDDPFVFTMMGGEATDVERARTVVETFSTNVEHMGPLGAGMATKIANNLVTWVQLVIGVQATNLSAHYGVSVDKLRSVMGANGNLTPTMGAMLEGKQKMRPGLNPDYDRFAASQAGIGEKDLALAIDHAAAVGLPTDMIAEARKLVRAIMTEPLAAATS